MSIKLITFDLDHTLWNPDTALRCAEQESHAWLADKVPAFAQLFPAQAFIDFRCQLRDETPALKHRISDIRRKAFHAALLQSGVNNEQAGLLTEEAFAVFWHARQRVQIFPQTESLLSQLARSYTLGAISNGNACLQAIGMADYFAFHFAADDFPAAKPAADMFVAALTKMSCAAHETVHIGDHPVDDIEGAQAAGLKTVWVNFSGAAWPGQGKPPDHTVQALDDIPAAISAIAASNVTEK
jgi:HAD superfamily hydrolase (TIGR01549 family)